MRSSPGSIGCRVRIAIVGLATVVGLCPGSPASAYNGHPKLIVVIVIDQFRGDYLERYREQFGDAGFRLLLDHGAYFSDCNYDYANTRTAPGHASLFTGAYSNGHGIVANDWWDFKANRSVAFVEDEKTTAVGMAGIHAGASPHNLLSDTLGDEMKLATQGKSRFCPVVWRQIPPTGSTRRVARGSRRVITGAICPSGRRILTRAAPPSTGTAIGMTHRARRWDRLRTAKVKTELK